MCSLSTAYASNSRGYDVVVVGDAVATRQQTRRMLTTIANGTCAKVLATADLIHYMEKISRPESPGAVKGTGHPDGRKEG